MELKLTLLFVFGLASTTNSFSQQVSAPSIETAFQNYLRAESGHINTGSILPVFLIKEDTKGSRYLYEKWVNGFVLGTDGVTYNSPRFKYNYDKINKKLFMLFDSTTVIELSSEDIAGFTMKGENDRELQFTRIKNSTDLNFYQPAYKDEKGYSLYKLLTTKFKKADFQTNGIIESGNKYDEYIDTEEYFIVSPKQELSKITFRKKSLEKVLENESSKVQTFFDQHKRSVVDEDFVKQLLQYLNSK